MALQPTLRAATPSDILDCAAIAHAAFAPSPIIRHIRPAAESVALGLWTAVVSAAFAQPHAHLVVAEDAASGELLGFAKWVWVEEGAVVPGIAASAAVGGDSGGDSEDERVGMEELWGMVGDREFAMEYFGAQAEQHERFMGRRAHWYLELISTKAEVKGRGTGRRLVQWGLERVDGDGAVAYLEASPQGRGLFERFGFEVVERLVYLDGAYVECPMVRAAKGKGE
ncbi:acyl-CoA N-acyltransferase [Chaetomium fimeti]|uniref:Acyl-CoA N-acyltransferase n=1 Tax=Chaetomium fimeti TaxID=1854472 RepID=A0AAE0LTL2_9PEZI|nr:acyl-CoA N-acyltransferase [Chaetomium fimeti]